MPTEPHRYAMEELLDEIPAGWKRTTRITFERKERPSGFRFMRIINRFHWPTSSWVFEYSPVPIPTQERKVPPTPFPRGPFPSPHTAMSAFDTWVEANP